MQQYAQAAPTKQAHHQSSPRGGARTGGFQFADQRPQAGKIAQLQRMTTGHAAQTNSPFVVQRSFLSDVGNLGSSILNDAEHPLKTIEGLFGSGKSKNKMIPLAPMNPGSGALPPTMPNTQPSMGDELMQMAPMLMMLAM